MTDTDSAHRCALDFQGLAVRGGAQAARSAGPTANPGGAPDRVRDRLWPVGAAAHRHLQRGAAHDHGAPCAFHALSRPADAADRVQRRHGRPAQGARQRAQPGDAGRASRQAADAHPRSVRHARKLRCITTMRCCATSSTASASTTSSRRSTDYYASGRFDAALKGVLRHYQAILGVMLPTLRAERRATYSPVLPISPTSGVVLQVPVEVVDADAGTDRVRGRVR